MPKATNTKGLTICLQKGGAAATALVPTAITKAKPAVVTVASAASLVEGMPALPRTTGFPELDGKVFAVGNITTNSFELWGSDTSASSGALGATPGVDVLPDAAMICVCLSEFTISRDAPEAIEAGTFCDPTLTVASAVAPAGTFEFTGNVNKDDAGYAELLQAEADGMERILRIGFPQGNGYVVAPVTINLVSWAFALDSTVQFTGAGTFTSKPTHAYDASNAAPLTGLSLVSPAASPPPPAPAEEMPLAA